MKYNTDVAFVGLPRLKEEQYKQLQQFEMWAEANYWMGIHSSHYDWWMFPIDEPSSFGYAWTVYEGEVFELKQDSQYIERYLRGVTLLGLSWGWDILQQDYIPNPKHDQTWQDWPVRLYKAAKSVKVFGFDTYFESLKKYANILMQEGVEMSYGRHDLSWLFK